jgi:vacuolar-type H+-ATPase subunit I/STV1
MPIPIPPPPRPGVPARQAGFVRHDLFLLVALVLLALAIAVPRLLQGQWKGALLGLLVLAGVVLGGLGLLLAMDWLQQASDRPARGWSDRLARALGHLLRFVLFGLIGAVAASALAVNHGLGAHGQDLAAAGTGLAAGLLGTALYLHLGEARFWPAFRWFGLALLGSFLAGILALLGPEPWSVDAGILIPLLVFLVFALRGRVAPAPPAGAPGTGEDP